MRRHPIRHSILLLLLALLPLQVSWAVVGEYCSHETGNVEHLGHHYHEHDAGTSTADSDRGQSSASHDDCGTCHAGSGMLVTADPGRALAIGSYAIDPGTVGPLVPHPVFEPEKPNWPRLA